jgi:glucans biosynthesis protein C
MQAQRWYFLDWLRIGAFALLVLYHVGMFYVPWDWHVKARDTFPALEPLMRLTNPWRMSLLFMLSGAATVWMLRRAQPALLRERTKRLLLPLITGMVLIVPLQPYFEVVQKVGYAGSYLDFLKLYFSAYPGFCRGNDCLVLPTWNHLWFLPYLWLYTVLLVLMVRLARPGLQSRLAGLLDRWAVLPAWAWWLLPALWLGLLRLALLTRFGTTHAFIDDGYQHAAFFSVFLLGAALGARPALFARLEPLRWPALLVAVAAWGAIGAYFEHVRGLPAIPEGLRAGPRLAHGAMQWSAIIAIIGFGHRHLNRDHRWRAPLTEAVFPVYLVHQTLIIGLAMACAAWRLPSGLEATLLVTLTFAGSLLFWRLARHTGPLRPWFGLPRR